MEEPDLQKVAEASVGIVAAHQPAESFAVKFLKMLEAFFESITGISLRSQAPNPVSVMLKEKLQEQTQSDKPSDKPFGISFDSS